MKPLRILFCASELYPLVKTGGLADVAASLPAALQAAGHDLRVALPAYRGTVAALADAREIAALEVLGQRFGLIEGRLPGSAVRLWLLDCPVLYDRAGDPYRDADGQDFWDNPWRFGCFSRAVALLALGAAGWRPDVVHANDWQSGLVPAWLAREPRRPRSVFTIHNLAYQGVYGRDSFEALQLPASWWDTYGLEYHGGWSFMKGGLYFADALTTVSPTYAREIQAIERGEGLHGLLHSRAAALHGIVNGIDDAVWNPARDPHLTQRYDAATVTAGKRANAAALRKALGLADDGAALLGVVTRFAWQKGADLILEAAGALLEQPVQLAVLGSGDPAIEAGFRALAQAAPGRVAVRFGYDEALAHRITAAADLFLMPSRFEPCGLNQMYSQRYGTLPVVRNTGGLHDTVDAGTGIRFERAEAPALIKAVQTALATLADAPRHQTMQQAGMARDFSWGRAAAAYQALYARLLAAV